MRRFQGGRSESEKVSKKNEQEYKDVGAMIPPIPPENGYHIQGQISVKYSDECVDRNIDEYIDGDAAKQLAAMAYDDMYQAILNQYQNGYIDEPGPEPGDCAPPRLTVSAVGDEG